MWATRPSVELQHVQRPRLVTAVGGRPVLRDRRRAVGLHGQQPASRGSRARGRASRCRCRRLRAATSRKGACAGSRRRAAAARARRCRSARRRPRSGRAARGRRRPAAGGSGAPPSGGERGPRALQRAVDRRDGGVEQLGHLVGLPAQHVAQDAGRRAAAAAGAAARRRRPAGSTPVARPARPDRRPPAAPGGRGSARPTPSRAARGRASARPAGTASRTGPSAAPGAAGRRAGRGRRSSRSGRARTAAPSGPRSRPAPARRAPSSPAPRRRRRRPTRASGSSSRSAHGGARAAEDRARPVPPIATLVTRTTPRVRRGGQHITGRRQLREPRTRPSRAGTSPTEMSSNRRSGRPDSRSTSQRDGSGPPPRARLDGMTADTLVLPTVAPSTPLPRSRGWFRQLGVDTGYVLVGFPLADRRVRRRRHRPRARRRAADHLGRRRRARRARCSPPAPSPRSSGRWLPAVLRRPLPRPAYLPRRGPAGRAGCSTPLRDPQAWLDALHAVVRFPLAIFSFVVTVTFWSVALGGLTYGAWDWALPDASTDPNNQDLLELVGLESTAGRRILALHRARPRVRRPAAVRRPRRRPAPGAARPGAADLPRGHPGRARPADRRAATPPSPRRPWRCAGSSATSTTARSSSWSA